MSVREIVIIECADHQIFYMDGIKILEDRRGDILLETVLEKVSGYKISKQAISFRNIPNEWCGFIGGYNFPIRLKEVRTCLRDIRATELRKAIESMRSELENLEGGEQEDDAS